MNYLEQQKFSVKTLYTLLFYCVCFAFLTGCAQESAYLENNTETRSIDLGEDVNATAGDAITLSSSVNNLDADALTYHWEQISGDAVSLTEDDKDYLAFTTTENDTLAFNVTATDSEGIEYTDTINVTVLPIDESTQGSVQISWNAPTENEDGSSLTNLAGYKIYYGQSEVALDISVLINDSQQTTYKINNLEYDHTYFFCVAARNTQGLESECSDTIEFAL